MAKTYHVAVRNGDGRMAVHRHRALPPGVAGALQAAFRPMNELLGTLLNDIAPELMREAEWLKSEVRKL